MVREQVFELLGVGTVAEEQARDSGLLIRMADAIEEHFEEIFTRYENALHEMNSLLALGAPDTEQSRNRLENHARFVLQETAAMLRDEQSSAPEIEDQAMKSLQESGGRFPELARTYPDETFRASLALTEASLSVLLDSLPSSDSSHGGDARALANAALTVQKTILERFARTTMLVYVDQLLTKVQEVQTEERKRISRDLHDQVSHSIGVARQNLLLYGALKERDRMRAEEKLKLAEEESKKAMEITSKIASELREPESIQSLETALGNLLETNLPETIRCDLSVIGDETLISSRMRVQLFLIVREAIRNVAAHANAKNLMVEVYITPDIVRAGVEDDGQGFDPEEAGLENKGDGLKSMEERASLIGGKFNLESASDGGGTKIEVLVPLGPE